MTLAPRGVPKSSGRGKETALLPNKETWLTDRHIEEDCSATRRLTLLALTWIVQSMELETVDPAGHLGHRRNDGFDQRHVAYENHRVDRPGYSRIDQGAILSRRDRVRGTMTRRKAEPWALWTLIAQPNERCSAQRRELHLPRRHPTR